MTANHRLIKRTKIDRVIYGSQESMYILSLVFVYWCNIILICLILQIWASICSGDAIKDPSILSRFLLLTFAVGTN